MHHNKYLSDVVGVETPTYWLEAKEILRMKDMLIGIMAENSGQPVEKVKADCERDHYLSAQESVEYGLIDKVVTSV